MRTYEVHPVESGRIEEQVLFRTYSREQALLASEEYRASAHEPTVVVAIDAAGHGEVLAASAA